MNDGEVVLTEDHDKNFRAVDFCPEEAAVIISAERAPNGQDSFGGRASRRTDGIHNRPELAWSGVYRL